MTHAPQLGLLPDDQGPAGARRVEPLKLQLLKWIGNKQRFAHEIIGYFPEQYWSGRATYFEPFLGSGAVLGTLAPSSAVAGDVIAPLIELWRAVATRPDLVKQWYAERYSCLAERSKEDVYEQVRDSYNNRANAADFLYISRAAYGGVVRFRRKDGFISTPCGAHNPIPPKSFAHRVDVWHKRIRHTRFECADFEDVMRDAKRGDVVYCDPPYSHSQAILYGSQSFDLGRLFEAIRECKRRGVYVLLSIDGSKRSGNLLCNIPIPKGLFEEEAFVNCGRSMLRRFQMRGESLEGEEVRDRLLLTY